MATPYEAREKKDEQRIAEVQRNKEQAVQTTKREVREVAGDKVIIKEDPNTGLVHQTKVRNGSWAM